MSAPLYNRDILSLAVATADFPPLEAPRHRVSARAPLCGSAIIFDLDTDDAGHVTAVAAAPVLDRGPVVVEPRSVVVLST